MVELINLKLYFYIYDEEKKKAFYTLPLAFQKKYTIEEFPNAFKYKEKSEFKDSPESQQKITNLLIKLEKEHGDFRYR